MTTPTVAMNPAGGPARRVKVVTDSQVQGGPAIPVYGWTGQPTDGRPVEGAPAMLVKVITDADLQINGGRYWIEGQPFAMPVSDDATVPTVSEGNIAVAVYPVNAWPSGGGGDPIGDALRASAVGYWKLDELASPWADSTPGNHPLTAVGSVPIVSVPGIVATGIGYVDQTTGINTAQGNGSIGTFPNWSASCWIKMHTTGGIGNTSDVVDLPADSGRLVLAADGNDSLLVYDGGGGSSADHAITSGAWHHVVVTSDDLNHTIWIDGSIVEVFVQAVPVTAFSPLNLLTGGWNNTDYYQLDELGFFDRIITPTEIAYLYNSGSGRTLYP